MICNPESKLFLQRNKSKLLKKIEPCKPIRLPIVKLETSDSAEKSQNLSEPMSFKSCLFNRIKTPKKRHAFKIKDLTKEFSRNVSEIYFNNLEITTRRTLKQIKSLTSFDSSQKSLKFQHKLYNSQKVTNKININPFNQYSGQPFLFPTQVKTVIKKVIRSISPCILRAPRKKIECSFLSISPIRNNNM